MKFDINNYKGRYVMHCKTEEEAKDFCNYLHEQGRTWYNGISYKDRTNYNSYHKNTVYYFNDGSFGSLGWAKDYKYTILEWSDFMNKFTKADLKTGDVIQRRNGDVEIVNLKLGMLIANNGWNDLDDIREDLTSRDDKQRWDIVAVRRPKTKGDCQFNAFEYKWGDLVYERTEPEEMTLAEICKLLGKEIKIVK